MPSGKKAFSSRHAGLDRVGRGQRVAGGRQLDADAGAGLAVQPREAAVALGAQLDAGHVAQAHAAAVGVGAQHDGAELLGIGRAGR
jgi:hypothetical protein